MLGYVGNIRLWHVFIVVLGLRTPPAILALDPCSATWSVPFLLFAHVRGASARATLGYENVSKDLKGSRCSILLNFYLGIVMWLHNGYYSLLLLTSIDIHLVWGLHTWGCRALQILAEHCVRVPKLFGPLTAAWTDRRRHRIWRDTYDPHLQNLTMFMMVNGSWMATTGGYTGREMHESLTVCASLSCLFFWGRADIWSWIETSILFRRSVFECSNCWMILFIVWGW